MSNGGVISDPPEIDLGKDYMVPVTWSNRNTTDLPELPDGYRWKITRSYLVYPLTVKLQYRGRFSMWHTERSQPAHACIEDIRNAAQFIMKMHNIRPVTRTDPSKFVGVYPPKKLEEA